MPRRSADSKAGGSISHAKQADGRRLRELAKAWLVIGSQSVGGGPSSLYLMRRELIDRRGWLTHREFLEDWALSKLSLGINQIALAAMEGIRVAGVPGMAVTLATFLLPSGAITAVMTAGYVAVRDEPLVRAALAGAAPVTAGMTVGLAYAFANGSHEGLVAFLRGEPSRAAPDPGTA